MKHLLILLVLFGAFTFMAPANVFAETAPAVVDANAAATEALATAGLTNPLKTDDIRVVIGRVIKVLLGLSGGLALLMFIWGGIIWMTSQGEPERIKKGQKTLIWAVIGLALLFVAYATVNWVINALQQSTG